MKPVRLLNLRMFVWALVALLSVVAVFVAYRQGAFTPQRSFILETRDGTNLRIGVPVEFGGFEIGKVEEVSLNERGLIDVRVSVRNAYTQWIRTDSRFKLDRPVMGQARILVETTDLSNALLPNDARRQLIASVQMSTLVESGTVLMAEVSALIGSLRAADSNFQKSLGALARIADNIETKGLLAAALKSEKSIRDFNSAIEAAPALLNQGKRSLEAGEEASNEARALIANLSGQVGKGQSGAVVTAFNETRATMAQVRFTAEEIQRLVAESRKLLATTSSATEGIDELRDRADRVSQQMERLIRDIERLGLGSAPPPARLP
jgi:ABC-type transporter Mla subunit MlaD